MFDWSTRYKAAGGLLVATNELQSLVCFHKSMCKNVDQNEKGRPWGVLWMAVLRIRIQSDPVFLGYPDPDPIKKWFRIRILNPQKTPQFFRFICNIV